MNIIKTMDIRFFLHWLVGRPGRSREKRQGEKLARMEEAGTRILVAKFLHVLGKSDTSQLLIHNYRGPHMFVLHHLAPAPVSSHT